MVFDNLWGIILNSLEKIILIAFIILATVVVAKIVSFLLKRFFKRSSSILKVDSTRYTFIRYLSNAIIYLLGLSISIYMIPSLRNLAVSLLAGAGILAIIVGFASQQAIANIVSGIFLVVFKPFRIGDRISVGATSEMKGIVEDITLRHTVIRNFENKRVIIPNSIISNDTIENSSITDEKICKWIDFGISYDSDVDKAKKIMIQEALKHPDHMDNRSEEEKLNDKSAVKVKVVGFGDSSVNLRLYVWCSNPAAAWRLGCDLNESIKKRFDKEGVEIPFPYRTIVFKNKKAKGKIVKKRKR